MTAVGAPLTRVDGRLKVTGQARYTADTPVEGLVHAVLVQSTIARGEITRLDVAAAQAAPGVLVVASHLNRPPLNWDLQVEADGLWLPPFGQRLLLLENATIHYSGQHIAVVVAETLEQARHAASLVEVDYLVEEPEVRLRDHLDRAVPVPGQEAGAPDRGDAETALGRAPIRLAGTFHTPMAHHNPLEPSATIAIWSRDRLTVYESTQSIFNSRQALSRALGIPLGHVRVLTPFVGGGFGCKGMSWPHTCLAAAVARMVGRPVKLVLTRGQSFSSHGHRAELHQTMELGAERDGRLIAIRHVSTGQTSRFDQVAFDGIEATGSLYTCPNVTDLQRTVALDLGNPAFMRSPESPAVHAMETLMDELSERIGVDPIELRLRNYATADQHHGHEFPEGRKHLRECYEMGARRFGWRRGRRPAPRSVRRGTWLIGQGMAGATHTYWLYWADARVVLSPDGRALAQSGTQDIGTGTYTTMTQIAADALGMAPRDVRFLLGDTAMPQAPVSAASTTSVTVGNAVHRAGRNARDQVIRLAIGDPRSPLHGADPDRIAVADGRLFRMDDRRRGETYRQILTRHGRSVEATGEFRPPTPPGEHTPPRRALGGFSYGAVFAQVRVDEATREVRLDRLVGAFDVGRVLNARTARSQAIGGMIWGVGQALMEHTSVDALRGRIVSSSLSSYLVPVEADIPGLEVLFVDRPDPSEGSIGVRGMGEVTAMGVSAAIANAVYQATGRRVRDLPITLDRLL